MEARIQDAVDHVEIRRLQDAYADLATRRAWGELAALVRPDATIALDTRNQPVLEFTGPASVGQFLGTAVERFEFFEFAIMSSHIELHRHDDPNVALARMHICETRCERGSHEWSRAHGVYHDRCERIDGRWWITGRRYHSLARESEPVIYAFPDLGSW